MVSSMVEWRARTWASFGVAPDSMTRVMWVVRRAWKSSLPSSVLMGMPAFM